MEHATLSEHIVFVDTSAWICFFARRGYRKLKEAISLLIDENRVATAGPILIELIQGCRDEKEKAELKMALEGLHWISVTHEIWHKAAEMAFRLRRKGVTVSAIDAIIATVAIEYDAFLLHRDKDYDLIARHTDLKIYNI